MNNQKNISGNILDDLNNNNKADLNVNPENLEYEELKNLYMNNIKNFHFKAEKPSKQIFNTNIPSNNNNNTNNNIPNSEFLDNSENFFMPNNQNNYDNYTNINNNQQHLSNDFIYEDQNIQNQNANFSNNNIKFNNNDYANFSNNPNSNEANFINANMNQIANHQNNYNNNPLKALKSNQNIQPTNNDDKLREKGYKSF